MNLQEDYCSVELSKLLEEKGFKCGATYSKGFVKDGNGFVGGLIRHEDKITHQMAMKWLREVHKLHIEIDVYEDIKYAWSLSNSDSGKYVIDPLKLRDKGYPTYEEAVEAALKYVLENLI